MVRGAPCVTITGQSGIGKTQVDCGSIGICFCLCYWSACVVAVFVPPLAVSRGGMDARLGRAKALRRLLMAYFFPRNLRCSFLSRNPEKP